MILPSDEDDHVCIETKFQTMISYFNFSTNRLESTTLKSMAHPKNNNMQRSGGPGAIPAYVFRAFSATSVSFQVSVDTCPLLENIRNQPIGNKAGEDE